MYILIWKWQNQLLRIRLMIYAELAYLGSSYFSWYSRKEKYWILNLDLDQLKNHVLSAIKLLVDQKQALFVPKQKRRSQCQGLSYLTPAVNPSIQAFNVVPSNCWHPPPWCHPPCRSCSASVINCFNNNVHGPNEAHKMFCWQKEHYSQKNHCNDNCNDFSDYNDIIAPLDKLIMLDWRAKGPARYC